MAEFETANIIELLGLQAHPEGGFFSETYRHEREAGDRSLCTAIYYLITAESPCAGETRVITIGADIRAGQRPQVLVPAGVWQGARVKPGGSYALVGATVSPGFDYNDFEIGDRDELVTEYPECAALIEALTS